MTTPQSCYFLGKNNCPQRISTPCFKTMLHELFKSTVERKAGRGTKTHKMCTERKIISFLFLEIQKKKNATKFYKIINKCDWTNITKKTEIHMYIQQQISCPLLIFFLNLHPSYLCSQTESVSLPSLIN